MREDRVDMIEGNLLIRASAGTGKTFALATRFIRLMLFDGVEPARIVALTFSRAAAQEIYTKLLERLWKAAETPAGAEIERKNLIDNLPTDKVAKVNALNIDWAPATFVELLRKVVAVQHLGAIATLDSFILRLVANFPLEMGFQNAVEVLDPAGEKDEVDRAAKSILGRTEDADKFAEAFRAAKKGSFSRMCAKTLGDLMDREGWRKFILEHPECKTWTAQSMAEELKLGEFTGFADISETQTAQVKVEGDTKWIDKFLDYLVSVKAGESPIPSKKTISVEFAQAVARHPNYPYVEHVKANGEIDKRIFSQAVFTAAHADLKRLADAYLRYQLKVVEAKIKLFAIIEKEYDAITRKTGKLTFQDLTNAAKDNSKIELENLRFRFDAKLDHWALDEFQDTSEVQWACLKDLVESAASGGGSEPRSVIAVGDLKQSIYTWRGGDDKPFEEMMAWPWFGSIYGRIENSKISYRYGKHIADFINRVFGPENIRGSGLIPEARSTSVERWLKDDCWLEHVPQYDQAGNSKVQDCVKVVGVELDDAQEADDEFIAALYSELVPVWKMRSEANSEETIGILVRRNEEGTKVAEYLRKRGLPVVWEGMNTVSDVPVVQAILNLLKLAEHPEDTFAWVAVNRLLPVREILLPTINSAFEVSAKVSEMLSHQGLVRTLKDFCGMLCRAENGLDGLSCSRLRALVRLAVDYERHKTSDYSVDGFARFVAFAGKRESATSSNAIRILSIHRSKGLTLDRVYVPLFESDQSSIIEPMVTSSLFGKGYQWVLPHIPADVAALNADTRTVLEAQRDARLLEQLRLYYVALTRSRKALTIIFPLKDHHGLLFRDLITKAVESFERRPCESGMILFEEGEAPAFKPAEKESTDSQVWAHSAAKPRVQRRSPSRLAHIGQAALSSSSLLTADILFGKGYGSAAKRGVDVHAVYEKIEWVTAEKAEELPEQFREAFVKPTPDATVWREQSYELLVDNCWETGQFDRVVFTGSREDHSATIYDFKTNSQEPGESDDVFAARMRNLYAEQLLAYRQALHRLTKIPLARIDMRLLLETTGQSIAIMAV